MNPKLTSLEKIGLRKTLGDMSNILLSMVIATMLYGFKMDDPDLVLPAKITDSVLSTIFDDDRITRDALKKMYHEGDDALVSFYSTILENEPVQNSAKYLYDAFKSKNIIPLDDDVFERMIERKLEMVLGKKAAVSGKTGKVYYKYIPASRQFADLDKSHKALQALRVWSEIVQPYDPTSINDYLSTPSATNNVLFKSLDASVNLANDEIEGKAEKFVQRGSYTSFTKKQYYESKSPWLRFTGIPTLYEETDESGLDARFTYTRGLGFGPIVFPKPDKIKNQNTTTRHKSSNRTLRR